MAKRFVRQLPDEMLHLDDGELDAVRVMLISILMKNTLLGEDEIYTYLFGKGKKILWH